MAELYVQQGHIDRAVAVYRKLVAQDPGDTQSAGRLQELLASAPTRGENMSFREHVQGLVESVPGAIACSIMGFDGIPIDSFQVEGAGFDVQTLLTEYSGATIQLRRAADEQPTWGNVGEFAVSTTTHTVLIRPLSHEYLVAAVLGPNALVGKARYKLRMIATPLTRELTA